MMMNRIKPFSHGSATAWEKTTIIFAVLIYLTTIITWIYTWLSTQKWSLNAEICRKTLLEERQMEDNCRKRGI